MPIRRALLAMMWAALIACGSPEIAPRSAEGTPAAPSPTLTASALSAEPGAETAVQRRSVERTCVTAEGLPP